MHYAKNIIALALWGLFVTHPAYAGTTWTFTIPSSTTGSFTSSEASSGDTVNGSYSRLANGFIKLTVTAVTGTNTPTLNSSRFALEVPGLALFTYPVLTTERKMISAVATGVCPTVAFTGILAYALWQGTAGTAYDVSNAAMPAFGTLTWDPIAGNVTVNNMRNLSAYATLAGFGSFSLAGTCANGVVTFLGAGDRGGKFYITNSNGGVYVTNTNRAILVLEQHAIPAAANLNGTYSMYAFDESANTNLYPARMTIAAGTTGTGDELTDVELGTTNTARTWRLSSITINTPINGVFEANLDLEGSANVKAACAVYFRNRTLIFCAAQSPGAAARPMNLVLVSDSSAFAPATLDTYGFGTGSVVTSVGTGADVGQGIALQSDGKIVLAGYAAADTAVVRFTRDGTLDTTFSGDGRSLNNIVAGQQDRLFGVGIDSNGKILAAGYANDGTSDNLLAMRLTSVGALDATFNGSGFRITTYTTAAERYQGMALQSNNRMVAVGYVQNANQDCLIARYTTGGLLDTTFSGDGIDVQNIGGSGNDQFFGITIQTDGKILACGFDNANGNQFVIMRYTTGGVLDTTFSGDGMQLTDFGTGQDRCQNMGMQNDGKSLAVGYATPGTINDVAVARYLSDGSLDTTFNGTGTVITTANAAAASRGQGIAVQTDGKIVVGGYRNNGTDDDFLIVRYTSAGALDTTFNSTGMLYTAVGTGLDEVQAIAIQSDEKIVVGGVSVGAANQDFAVMRIWP